MPEPTPPLTGVELFDLFNRYVADENIAAIRLQQSDYCERMAVQRLEHLRAMWRKLGVQK
jgi:hypothetical protein